MREIRECLVSKKSDPITPSFDLEFGFYAKFGIVLAGSAHIVFVFSRRRAPRLEKVAPRRPLGGGRPPAAKSKNLEKIEKNSKISKNPKNAQNHRFGRKNMFFRWKNEFFEKIKKNIYFLIFFEKIVFFWEKCEICRAAFRSARRQSLGVAPKVIYIYLQNKYRKTNL